MSVCNLASTTLRIKGHSSLFSNQPIIKWFVCVLSKSHGRFWQLVQFSSKHSTNICVEVSEWPSVNCTLFLISLTRYAGVYPRCYWSRGTLDAHMHAEYQIMFLDLGTAVNPGRHSGNMQTPHQGPEFFSCEGRTFLPWSGNEVVKSASCLDANIYSLQSAILPP